MIKLSVQSVTEQVLHQLQAWIKKYKGKHLLKIKLIDYQNQAMLDMVSKDTKINVCNELVDELVKAGLEYKINA